MREVTIERYLYDQVKKAGGYAYKFVSPGRRGVPDRLIVMPGGVTWFCEVKTPQGKLSPLQVAEITQLRALGCNVSVIWSKKDIDELMEVLHELNG